MNARVKSVRSLPGKHRVYDLSVENTHNFFANGIVAHNCDTTGVEPDFALVKFKKLAGGGYFKIINQSIKPALTKLGYSADETKEIIAYVVGHGTLEGAPKVNTEALKQRGLDATDLEKIETNLPGAFSLADVVSGWTLGNETMERLGIDEQTWMDPNFNLLRHLGFSARHIKQANIYACGTQTVEGAPYLKEEHLEVFDCANQCGELGQRFIHTHGHIRMMSAAQSFISGAISKTINMPNSATVDDVKEAYILSWKLGLKANALYRDGCKLSQPLSTKSSASDDEDEDSAVHTEQDGVDSAETIIEEPAAAATAEAAKSDQRAPLAASRKELAKQLAEEEASAQQAAGSAENAELSAEQVLAEVRRLLREHDDDFSFRHALTKEIDRLSLPSRRSGFTQKAKIGGHTIFLRTGEYNNGQLGEIFVDMHKEGAAFRSLLNCFAIAVSLGLQHGVPLEEFADKFLYTRFEPAGFVQKHPNIKTCTSVVDFIFRVLSLEYTGRTDVAQVPPVDAETSGDSVEKPSQPELTPRKSSKSDDSSHSSLRDVQNSSDQPAKTEEETKADEKEKRPIGFHTKVAANEVKAETNAAQQQEVTAKASAATATVGGVAMPAPGRVVIEQPTETEAEPTTGGQTESVETDDWSPDFGNQESSGYMKQLGSLMGDAPPCDVCGTTMRRNGACYICPACGHGGGCG